MGWRRANRAAGLTVALWFFGRAHGFDGNGRREWTGRFQRNRGAGSLVSRGDRFNAIGAVKGFLVISVLLAVQALIGDANQLIGLLDRKSTRLNSSHSQISYA